MHNEGNNGTEIEGYIGHMLVVFVYSMGVAETFNDLDMYES